MDGFLSKPIDPQLLFAVVEQGDEGGSVAAAAGPMTFDEHALRHRLSGDNELMTDVIRMFLRDLPVRLVAIKRARQTVAAMRKKRQSPKSRRNVKRRLRER